MSLRFRVREIQVLGLDDSRHGELAIDLPGGIQDAHAIHEAHGRELGDAKAKAGESRHPQADVGQVDNPAAVARLYGTVRRRAVRVAVPAVHRPPRFRHVAIYLDVAGNEGCRIRLLLDLKAIHPERFATMGLDSYGANA